MASTRKIITAFVYPPIPYLGADWQAHYDGDEPNDDGQMIVGTGSTEAEAIADLEDITGAGIHELDLIEVE